MTELAAEAGHPLSIDRLDPGALMAAMIASFVGNEAPLRQCLLSLVVD